MEARQTFRGSAVPRSLLVVLAISIAVALAFAAALIMKDFGSSNAGGNATVHPAAGTVLRQDNPVAPAPILIDRNAGQQLSAPAGTHVGRSAGPQSIDGPLGFRR